MINNFINLNCTAQGGNVEGQATKQPQNASQDAKSRSVDAIARCWFQIVKNSPFAKVRVIPGKGYVTFEDYVKVHQQPSMPKPQLEEQSLPVETATSNKGWPSGGILVLEQHHSLVVLRGYVPTIREKNRIINSGGSGSAPSK